MFKNKKILLLVVFLLLANEFKAQSTKIILNNLKCIGLSDNEFGKDEILIKIKCIFEGEVLYEKKQPVNKGTWNFKKGDQIENELLMEFNFLKDGIFQIEIEFYEEDYFFLKAKEEIIGGVTIMLTIQNSVILAKWSFDYDVLAVRPFPFGENTYGFSMFGEGVYFEAILLIEKSQ
jgi:hypothetical protein